MAVSFGHPDGGMPHQLADREQVRRGFHQSAGEAMPEGVKTYPVPPVRNALVKEFVDHILESSRSSIHGISVMVSKSVILSIAVTTAGAGVIATFTVSGFQNLPDARRHVGNAVDHCLGSRIPVAWQAQAGLLPE